MLDASFLFRFPHAFCLSVLLLFVGLADPARAQDTPVSGSEANDALAQAMQSRGLTPAEGFSVADYIETRTTQGSDGAIRHVRLHIGPDGHVIPKPEWRTYHPNYCKQQARYMQETDKVLDFKIIRSTERANGVTRNQITVFARLRDRASDGTLTTLQQREGEATNMTGVQRADEGDVADALEAAYAKLQGLAVQAPASPCGEVRLEHVAGEEEGDDFIFQAGFQGSYGRYLDYTWNFGDGSGPVSGGKRGRHVYDEEGTYEVSVYVEGENVEPGMATIEVEVEGEDAEPASCTFTAEVSGPISGTFEGKATIAFDSEGGTARATDLTLESEGFDLKVGLRPAHQVGAAETLEGTMVVASSETPVVNTLNENTGPLQGRKVTNGLFQQFSIQDESDFVTIEVQKSRVIRWKDLPKSLRDYSRRMFSRMAGGRAAQPGGAMSPQDRSRYEQQVGDVAVQGVLHGRLKQSKLITGLVEEAKQITFRAEFDAGGSTFGCDYEGFPQKMEQRLNQVRQQMEQLKRERQGGGR